MVSTKILRQLSGSRNIKVKINSAGILHQCTLCNGASILEGVEHSPDQTNQLLWKIKYKCFTCGNESSGSSVKNPKNREQFLIIHTKGKWEWSLEEFIDRIKLLKVMGISLDEWVKENKEI